MTTTLYVLIAVCCAEAAFLSALAVLLWRQLVLVAIRRWRVRQEIKAMDRWAREVFSELR